MGTICKFHFMPPPGEKFGVGLAALPYAISKEELCASNAV